MDPSEIAGRAHHAVMRAIVERGHAPAIGELAAALGTTIEGARAALEALHAGHGLVLDPTHRDDVWIAHPFALAPTATWVEAGARGWWAPCLWCALGVAHLAAPSADIHTRFGGEHAACVIEVVDGAVRGDAVVHFAVPPRDAWDNVVRWCATVQPFARADDVGPWCERHAIARGAVVPIAQVADLAARWYGRHLEPAWRKWTLDEANAIFAAAGLTGEFWRLPAGAGTY